jgi:hypothetical protein
MPGHRTSVRFWLFSVGYAILATPVPLELHAALNAMPSFHMAWALLIFWYGLKCAWPVRIGGTVFAAFTVLATLGLGEHYLIDLVVAAPLTAAIDVLCAVSEVSLHRSFTVVAPFRAARVSKRR